MSNRKSEVKKATSGKEPEKEAGKEGAAAGAPADHKNAPGQAAQPAKPKTQISCSRGFSDWMAQNNLSFGFTSYQSGRLYLVGRLPRGRISFHERHFVRAMGVAATPQRLYLANHFQIWRMENILPANASVDGFDRNYVPRNAQTTGDLDVHELGVDKNGRIIFVNTKYSCLATPSLTHSFRPIWKPPFISRLAPEDRCHLNGLAMQDGEPRYVTAVCKSDIVTGWRDRRAEGGCIIDVTTDRIVTEKLSMPHSPRLHNGKLWVLNSGRGELCTVDPDTGALEAVAFLPGFLRGLAFAGPYAFVGLSLPRDGSFSGLELDGELARRDAEPWCGVQVVDTRTGDIVQWIRLTGEVRELFDVFVLPGVRNPMATGLMDSQIQSLVTIENWAPDDLPADGVPDGDDADRAPTPEKPAPEMQADIVAEDA
ncbi:TIGR03032 family protein [Parvibaculum sp.]|uniref:TIGR03032 family protein n=1 Tax=Parvibaculum sp. TaxID=2024848 RepID=UPI0025FCEEE9|nr:TIGR03032 family protein [Parvibaculum sp.]